MMLQVQGSTASDESQNQGLLDEHWEVETPRRTMRFLASVLILISIMQVQHSSKLSLLLLLWNDVLADANEMNDKTETFVVTFGRMRQRNGTFF